MYIYIYIYIYIYTRDVIFAVVVNELGNPISNHERGCLNFHHHIIMYREHGFLWHTLFFSLHPSLSSISPAGPLNDIQCLHRADVINFLLINQNWHVNPSEFMRKRHLWVHPCFSSNIPHVLFVLLGWFLKWKKSSCTLLCTSHLAFYPYLFSMHPWDVSIHSYSVCDLPELRTSNIDRFNKRKLPNAKKIQKQTIFSRNYNRRGMCKKSSYSRK